MLMQKSLILQIAVPAYVQEQSCALVLRGMEHPVKLFHGIPVDLEIDDEPAQERNQAPYIPVFLGSHQFFQDFPAGPGLQLKPGVQELLLQMLQHRSPVPVGGKRIDQFRPVLPVQKDLVIDCLLVAFQRVPGIPVIPAVLRDPEVLNVGCLLALHDPEVRGIGLARILNMVRIQRFILVVQGMQIQEIGNLDLFTRAQHLALDRYHFPRLHIQDLLLIGIQFPAHGHEPGAGNMIEECIQVLALKRRIKICAEKKDQPVDHAFIAQHRAAQVIPDHIIQPAFFHNVHFLRVLLMHDGIPGRVERGNGTGKLQLILDMLSEFIHGLVRKGDDQDLGRVNPLAFHQIPDLGRHGCRLPGTGACHHQAVVLIGQNHLALIVIQPDARITGIQNMIQILLFCFHGPADIFRVPRFHGTRECIVLFQCFLYALQGNAPAPAERIQCPALFQGPEPADQGTGLLQP